MMKTKVLIITGILLFTAISVTANQSIFDVHDDGIISNDQQLSDYYDFPMTVDFQPASGGGTGNNNPVIKAKFEVSEGIYDPGVPLGFRNHEHTPTPAAPYRIDDDWLLNGTQVDPPMIFDGETWVGYYMFAFDPDGNQELNQAYLDVYHPTPTSPLNQIGDGSFKYNIIMQEIPVTQMLLDFIYNVSFDAEASGDNNIICYGNMGTEGLYNWTDLWHELLNGQLKMYYAHKTVHYCQPAGYYRVEAKMFDIHGGSDMLVNWFEYVLGIGIETDFDELNFGEARMSTWKWIFGDWFFGTPEPTIRSIGNWDVNISLLFDDFGMGGSDNQGTWEWNVVFDVRLGDTFGVHANRSHIEKSTDINGGPEYDNSIWPDNQVTLPSDWDPRMLYPTGSADIIEDDYFTKCNTSKISFGIHIRKQLPYGVYGENGIGDDDNYMTLGVHLPDHIYEFWPYLPCGQR